MHLITENEWENIDFDMLMQLTDDLPAPIVNLDIEAFVDSLPFPMPVLNNETIVPPYEIVAPAIQNPHVESTNETVEVLIAVDETDSDKGVCPDCGKLITLNYLRTHIRKIHRKLERFLCRHCDKAYTRKFDVKRHMASCHKS